jgi:MFS family permease
MNQKIFVSYSRREIGFVDDLVRNLEEKKYQVWLDYRSLVPGSPWEGQIYKGIDEADVILLVVSKSALASENVEVEWRAVLKKNKRIILLIFEAVDLPTELESYEWVDFRGNYKTGLDELLSQLRENTQKEYPVPQTGFKVPTIVWAAALFSVFVGFFSLFAFWTLFIPWLLVLLPYRIFKRDFIFSQVQAAILFLPMALFLSIIATPAAEIQKLTLPFLLSFFAGGALFFILRSPAMQRWGKEQATMPKFSNPYIPNNPNPKSKSFFVDYAPQDRKVAEELTSVLKKYGHEPKEKSEDADSVFVLLSRFKSDSDVNPEKQVVFPVVVQSGEISEKLSKIQWIDLRTGLHGLDAIAQLLPEPDKLLKALGNRPRGRQLILSKPIATMYYFLILLGVFIMGSFFKLFTGIIFSSGNSGTAGYAFGYVLIPYLLNLLVTGALIFFMTRTILQRRGWLASVWNFTFAFLVLGGFMIGQFSIGGNIVGMMKNADPNIDTFAVNVVLYPAMIYMIGAVVMLILFFYRRKDVVFWFPARVK